MQPSEPKLSETLVTALETVDREINAVETARTLSQRNLSPDIARHAVRALKYYINGELDRSAQIFETIAEELRACTLTIQERR